MARLSFSSSGVFTVPADRPFLDVLAADLISHYKDDPLSLSRVLVLLPSQRSCRALRDVFLRITDGIPTLLPRMQPLSELSEEESPVWLEAGEGGGELFPPASQPFRQIMLATLVARAGIFTRGDVVNMEQGALLARELMRLLDDMARAGLGFEGLDALAPEELSDHWQKTVSFLRFIEREWPQLLERSGVMEPVARRNHQLRLLARHWRESPPDYPVIAAGSTGSQAATAELLAVIAKLPQGRVILPGLDATMPQEEWDSLTESHPQWGMRQLLAFMEISRGSIQALGEKIHTSRTSLISQIFRPSAFCGAWRELDAGVVEGLAGIERVECETPREEARVIALALRQALETEGAQAAVITQDRALARMITAEMQRFDVVVDDSAGKPVLSTPCGAFLLLTAECAGDNASPVSLLSLLKHPLSGLGFSTVACRHATRVMEREMLRGIRPAFGIQGLRQLLKTSHKGIPALLDALESALGDFMGLLQKPSVAFDHLLSAHLRACETLAATADQSGAERLWADEAGEVLSAALSELSLHAGQLGSIHTRQYAGILRTLLAGSTVREVYGTHPRLHILSPMEARLQQFDLAILAGLNEDSWPRTPEPSPWMSRPMQQQFGLPLPEEAVGKSAHDFAMLLHCPRVLLTRSRKSGGTVATPSRWLLRLDTLLSAEGKQQFVWPESPLLHFARVQPSLTIPPLMPPAPRPPAQARPKKLSVTEIETLQRDPYQVYAKHVLGLKKLHEIDEQPSAREFGDSMHAALENFCNQYPDALPQDAEARLGEAGEEVFRTLAATPSVVAYWQPRFAAMVPWIIAMEHQRRGDITQIIAERKGELQLGDFTLTTKIDRLELHKDGSFSVIDYKSGSIPEGKDIKRLVSLQLPLEALIVRDGVMETPVEVRELRELSYWKLSGRKNKEKQVMQTPEAARERLQMLIDLFANEQTPYLAVPDAQLAPRHNNYEHLERKEEWEWQEGAA